MFDAELGLSEDRPLARFDQAHEDQYGSLGSFGVSESGQTLAAAICYVGLCNTGVAEDASPNAELRLWVSPDGGSTWQDWGELPPDTEILKVTNVDVLVEASNTWRHLTGEARDAMLVRLGRLGIDRLDDWTRHATWVMSGEAHAPPSEPSPPTVEGVDWWFRLDDQAADSVAWVGWAPDTYLLALADESGAVRRLYSAAGWARGSFIADELLVASGSPAIVRYSRIASVDLVDLSTSSAHQLMGLQQRQDYRFITARPIPASLSARPVIHYAPLTLAEPRPQPADIAIYYGAHGGEGVWDVYKTVPSGDGEAVAVARPWAFFDERPGYVDGFGVDPRGQTLAALKCSRGTCAGLDGPSEDAQLVLWVSLDTGATWDEWGELQQYTWIVAVTGNDVALEQWVGAEAYRTFWFRSGDEVAPPQGHEVDWFEGWFPDAAGTLSPLWRLRGEATSYVTATGRTLPVPATGDNRVWSPILLSDGILWSQLELGGPSLFVVADEAGAVRDAYAWIDLRRPLGLSTRLDDHRFLGELGPWGDWPGTTKVLVDFATGTVHPLSEVPGHHHGRLSILAAQHLTE